MTGFYATYIIGREENTVLWHRFPSSNGLSLREAIQDERNNCSPYEKGFEWSVKSCSPHWQLRRIVDELRSADLWYGAYKDGALNTEPERFGVVFSASKHNFLFYDFLNPTDLLYGSSDAPSYVIAQKIGAQGPRLSPVAACATGAHCIALGAQLIEDGYADVAICGAIEPVLSPLVLAAYENMGALSKSHLMRPFDTSRDGFVPNVGAGCLILENEDKARERGAEVLGYLSGWAMNADATHMTAMCPSGDSIARSIEYSMKRADISQIDYINAHGTATKLNDETEARGIKSALGNRVPVSSTKPLTGHLLGAAGAVEAVISLLALRENFAPPTLNLQNIDTNCDLDLVVGQGRDVEMQSVLSLNYGFGGHIGALLFTKN